MENTYWNGCGKHQDFLEQLEEKAPGHGFTSNVFMNLHLTMANLYYDAYNNGGGNIEECYARYYAQNVQPYLPDIRLEPFLNCDFPVMEQMMDRALEYLQDKPLDFPLYTVWLNGKGDEFSHIEPVFPEAQQEGWRPVTFGMEDELNKWCSVRGFTDRDVSYEIEAKNKEAREHSLPGMCYSTLKSTGELIVIKKGESGYFKTDHNTNDPAENSVRANRMNKMIGVTGAQLKAMEFGSMFGWDKPGAKPEAYLKKPLDSQISTAASKQAVEMPPHEVHAQSHSFQEGGPMR